MSLSHHARVLILAAGAAFLALLDVTVVNLAIPALNRAYPSTTVTRWRPLRVALATTLKPAEQMKPVFMPSAPG